MASVGSAPRVYIAAVAASRESSTGSSYTTPTASFFRGFGFRFADTRSQGRGGFLHIPLYPIPLFISLLPLLFSVALFSRFHRSFSWISVVTPLPIAVSV